MTAWTGFGIAVATVTALALVATILVLGAVGICRAARFLYRRGRLWRMIPASRRYDRENDPAGSFWAGIADGHLRNPATASALQGLQAAHAVNTLRALGRETGENGRVS